MTHSVKASGGLPVRTQSVENQHETDNQLPALFPGHVDDAWSYDASRQRVERSVTTLDGVQGFLPADVAACMVKPGSKTVHINAKELTLLNDYFFYGVLPPMEGTQCELLRRIALAHDLPRIGAALGAASSARTRWLDLIEEKVVSSEWLSQALGGISWRTHANFGSVPTGYNDKVVLPISSSICLPLARNRVSEIYDGFSADFDSWVTGLAVVASAESLIVVERFDELKEWANQMGWAVNASVTLSRKASKQPSFFESLVALPPCADSMDAYTTTKVCFSFSKKGNTVT